MTNSEFKNENNETVIYKLDRTDKNYVLTTIKNNYYTSEVFTQIEFFKLYELLLNYINL